MILVKYKQISLRPKSSGLPYLVARPIDALFAGGTIQQALPRFFYGTVSIYLSVRCRRGDPRMVGRIGSICFWICHCCHSHFQGGDVHLITCKNLTHILQKQPSIWFGLGRGKLQNLPSGRLQIGLVNRKRVLI